MEWDDDKFEANAMAAAMGGEVLLTAEDRAANLHLEKRGCLGRGHRRRPRRVHLLQAGGVERHAAEETAVARLARVRREAARAGA
eukprot:6979565-Prymnesium_polylepis.1